MEKKKPLKDHTPNDSNHSKTKLIQSRGLRRQFWTLSSNHLAICISIEFKEEL